MPGISYYSADVVSDYGDPFPIDMLRHDNCFPSTRADAALISNSLSYPDSAKGKIVTVLKASSSSRLTMPFSPERWKSFGWSVLRTRKL